MNRTEGATALTSDVESIVSDLESLRRALEEVDRTDPTTGPGQTSPAS